MAHSQGSRSYKYAPRERPGHLIPTSPEVAFPVTLSEGMHWWVTGSRKNKWRAIIIFSEVEWDLPGEHEGSARSARVWCVSGVALFLSSSPMPLHSEGRKEDRHQNTGWRTLGSGCGVLYGVTQVLGSLKDSQVFHCSRYFYLASPLSCVL